MIKSCDESISKPLGITTRSFIDNGKFSSESKKTNVVPNIKKKQQARVQEPSPYFFTVCFSQNIRLKKKFFLYDSKVQVFHQE